MSVNITLWERINMLSKRVLLKSIINVDPYGRATELNIGFSEPYKNAVKSMSIDELQDELYQKVYYIDEETIINRIEGIEHENGID